MAPNVVALAGGDRADDQLPSQVILMDVATGSRLGTLLGSPGQSYTVAFSADGSKIAAAPIPNFHFRNAVIDVWDVTTRQRLHTFRCFCAWDLKFSPDGTVLSAAGGARDRAGIQHFDLRNWRGISFIEGALPSACLDYRPDGGQIATGDFDGQVRLIDTKSPSATITANDVGYQLLGTCYASDGRAVFAGGSSGHVKIWDAKTGESRASLKASGPVVSLCSSRDGEILAAGCRNGTITVWYRDGRREIVSVE
jgi:WD40 repeat protein